MIAPRSRAGAAPLRPARPRPGEEAAGAEEQQRGARPGERAVKHEGAGEAQAARPPLTSGLAAVPTCTLSASQPKAAPRGSPGTSGPPSE